MDPSSLIFVAVIGIWAAYLLGHWVRRRDQLATARSIDRFSEGMRVLERRAPAPTVSTSATRAHVVSARVTAPGATASARYAATGPARGRTVRASVAAPLTAAGPATGRRAVVTAALNRVVAAVRAGSSAPVAPQQVQATGATRAAGSGPAAVGRVGVSPAAARRRGRLLAGLVVATALGWVFAGVTPLPWFVPAVVSCLLVAFTVGLRRALVRERSAARRAARATSGLPRQTVVGRPSTEPRDVRLARRAAVQAELPDVVSPPVEEAEQDLVIDLRDVAPDRVAERFPSAPVGPGWLPVPVPVPTYTLKPKAPARPRPEAPVAEAEPAPLDLDEIIERRIASGA